MAATHCVAVWEPFFCDDGWLPPCLFSIFIPTVTALQDALAIALPTAAGRRWQRHFCFQAGLTTVASRVYKYNFAKASILNYIDIYTRSFYSSYLTQFVALFQVVTLYGVTQQEQDYHCSLPTALENLNRAWGTRTELSGIAHDRDWNWPCTAPNPDGVQSGSTQ